MLHHVVLVHGMTSIDISIASWSSLIGWSDWDVA